MKIRVYIYATSHNILLIINIDFSWQRGFIPVYDDGDMLIKIGGKKGGEREFGNLFTNNLLLRIGYAF